VAALGDGVSGDVRMGFNSNGQIYFQATGGLGVVLRRGLL